VTNPPARASASSTANWIAAARARESERPDALFRDPYAAVLAGDVGRASLAASERASGGENHFLAVRTRFIDEVLIAEARAEDAVVLLGAGLDTRAFRLPLPPDIDWYEIDDGALMASKERVLQGLGAHSPCRTRLSVAADLGGSWGEALLDAGFVAGRRTIWLAEGLLFYLSTEVAGAVLGEACHLSGPGSLILADVSGTGLHRLAMMQPYLASQSREGLPPPFATDDPAGLLRDAGWTSVALFEPWRLAISYGRPLGPHAAGPSTPDPSMQSYFVLARPGG
jgi:methyltransferase (TIGR00027 family)